MPLAVGSCARFGTSAALYRNAMESSDAMRSPNAKQRGGQHGRRLTWAAECQAGVMLPQPGLVEFGYQLPIVFGRRSIVQWSVVTRLALQLNRMKRQGR